jgi:hypothetical protein
MEKSLENVDKKISKQVRIDAGWHQILKDIAKREGTTLISLLDGIFSEYLSRRSLKGEL